MAYQEDLDDRDDRDDPQPEDIEDLDHDDGFERCTSCGRAVYEGVPKCPYCGQWLLEDTDAARRSRGWLWPIMVALLLAVILVLWHGFGM